ncbi:hypothetical protein Sgou_56440 [Streptomyces gougerotii]|uniref:Uncharacterized protein n=2 Tax=Streptomyces diastaticus group TaxID=2849069 RepID=A0A8H9HW80_9ACTN|nr:hypothetical protein Srut_34060 [Streptomyces rutgersensis]GFH72173.1 hypothetical protein Sdia_29410 [Streptomyces diastaticus subsp. diastaticus]GFH80974.1 hypothetical protein Sgou_56440 [Streptomyces gougerotii]GGU26309.1 hypothetical protein GCM10015534_31020 [Streptomyces diastaticus subsp. diastaticus]GGU89801.1 hypothetical protein GCM10010227_51070 [Streptomyces gougerotii]
MVGRLSSGRQGTSGQGADDTVSSERRGGAGTGAPSGRTVREAAMIRRTGPGGRQFTASFAEFIRHVFHRRFAYRCSEMRARRYSVAIMRGSSAFSRCGTPVTWIFIPQAVGLFLSAISPPTRQPPRDE